MPIATAGQADVCRQKPNGSMQPGQGLRRLDMETWTRSRGIRAIPTTPRIPLAKRCRTRGGFTTCWAASGSGAMIGTEHILRTRLPIRKGPRAANKGWGAVDPFFMNRILCACRCGAEIRPGSQTQTWDFVVSGIPFLRVLSGGSAAQKFRPALKSN
jgi:hypothetical protein